MLQSHKRHVLSHALAVQQKPDIGTVDVFVRENCVKLLLGRLE
jgi:hypothetical protein